MLPQMKAVHSQLIIYRSTASVLGQRTTVGFNGANVKVQSAAKRRVCESEPAVHAAATRSSGKRRDKEKMKKK